MGLARTVNAAVFNGPCGNVADSISIREFELDELQPDQVLVRVTCCTICGSDMHTTLGNRSQPTPSILGHEIIGTVEQIGTNVACKELTPGDRITWSVAASCGPTHVAQASPLVTKTRRDARSTQCPHCQRGIPQKCDSLFKYGHEPITSDVARALSGGLATYCVLQPGTSIVPLPDDLPDEVASPASCATATVMASIRTMGDIANQRVLVTGAGMLGLTTAAVAKSRDANEIVVCDVNPTRRELGEHFEATNVVESAPDDSFDCIFEMSGNPAAVATAFDRTTIGSRIVLVGSVSPSDPVPLDPEQIVRKLISIYGVHNYRPDDLLSAVKFLSSNHKQFPFASLVEKTFPLSETAAAFEYAASNHPIRVAVKPDELC